MLHMNVCTASKWWARMQIQGSSVKQILSGSTSTFSRSLLMLMLIGAGAMASGKLCEAITFGGISTFSTSLLMLTLMEAGAMASGMDCTHQMSTSEQAGHQQHSLLSGLKLHHFVSGTHAIKAHLKSLTLKHICTVARICIQRGTCGFCRPCTVAACTASWQVGV